MEVENYNNIVNPIRRAYLISGDGRRYIMNSNYSHKKGDGGYNERDLFETGKLIDVVA